MPDVILLGDINIDIIAPLSSYPALGTEGQVVGSLEYHTGGSVVSTALGLANMGANVGIIGRVGSDTLAEQALTDLKNANIDTSQIQTDRSVSTGLIYIVVTPDGERTMFSSRGANVFTEVVDGFDMYFDNSRWFHFSGYSLLANPQQVTTLHGLERAREVHARVSLDPGPEPAMRVRQQLITLLPKIEIFFPNEQELMFLGNGKTFDDAIKYLLANGAKAVVAKQGAEGCTIVTKQHHIALPAFEISVVDTTGAGDSFNTGVILGRMVGLSWQASGVLGNALGGLAAANKGTGTGAIDARDIAELITQDQFKPQWAELQPALEEVLVWL